MTEIESLQVEIDKLKEAKSNAAKEQRFELSATLRDREKILLSKISDLVTEVQSVIKYASLHLQNTA